MERATPPNEELNLNSRKIKIPRLDTRNGLPRKPTGQGGIHVCLSKFEFYISGRKPTERRIYLVEGISPSREDDSSCLPLWCLHLHTYFRIRALLLYMCTSNSPHPKLESPRPVGGPPMIDTGLSVACVVLASYRTGGIYLLRSDGVFSCG